MTEENTSSGWGLWGFVETVKAATAGITSVLQEDVKEFTTTISKDTKTVIEQTTEKIVKEAQQGEVDNFMTDSYARS